MRVEKEHFVDAGEKDAEGYYDYYYEGDNYTITFDDVIYHTRIYIDEPWLLFFQSRIPEQKPNLFDRFLLGETPSAFLSIPYREPEFRECVAYFKNMGVREFRVPTGKGKDGFYETVDFSKLPADMP